MFDVALQEIAVKAANEDWLKAIEALTRGKDKLETSLRAGRIPRTGCSHFTEAQKARERRENVDLMKGEAGVKILAAKAKAESKKLEKVEAMKPALLTQEAKEEVARYRADVAKAQYAVDSCLVKAAAPGTVEHVLYGPGAVIYPQTPAPVAALPSGPRISLEPRSNRNSRTSSPGVRGKPVVVGDNNNFTLTYAGTVKRIGQAFMPKRNQGIEAFGY